jgi:hypothetical protein
MFEIAGGILLAIAVLYVLPTLLTLAFYTTLIIVLLVLKIILFDASPDIEAFELKKYEAVKAFVAQLLVPNKLPVNPKVEIVEPVTTKEPEIIALPVYGKAGVLGPPPPPLEEDIV